MGNYAFIDSQNVNIEIQKLHWKVDWVRLRTYLKEKYRVEIAYLFLGYLPDNEQLYQFLRQSGYVLIFKEVMEHACGTIKGNCDAELVLQTMIDFDKFDKAIIVTGDGDFACLVRYLRKKNKLEKLLVPNIRKYSFLLRKAAKKNLMSLCMLRHKIEYLK